MKQFDFPSSSGPKIYHTLINDNGLLSCDCPGWTVKKLGKVRECKHTKKVAGDLALSLIERDGQWFVIDPVDELMRGVSAGFAADVPKAALAPQQANVPASPDAQPKSNRGKRPDAGDGQMLVIDSERRTEPSLNDPAPSRPTSQTRGFISPMLANSMPEGKDADAFNSDWIMEEKYDGHRLIIRVAEEVHPGKHLTRPDMIVKTVSAWSRPGNVRTLPHHIHDLMLDMPVGVYDGELIVPESQHSYRVTAGQSTGKEALVLFDMLEVQGESIMGEPLGTRRQMLEIAYDVFYDHITFPIRLADQHEPSMEFVKEVWVRGGEGAIIKKLSARYQPGWRTPDWIKVKQQLTATLTIIGFVAGKNGPYSVVKLRDDHGVETTAKTTDNAMMRLFAKAPDTYLGKRVVINFQEKMPSGKYRHPMLERFAGDKE